MASPGRGQRLSMCIWGMPVLSRSEAGAVARALGFDGIDVGSIGVSEEERGRIVASPLEVAEELRALDLPIANYFYFFGSDLRVDRNLADPSSQAANLDDLAQVLRLCEAAAVPTLTLSPGIVNPGQTLEQATEASAAFLARAVEMAGESGIMVMTEPGVLSIVESPAATESLLARVPGLGLVLDYSHFVCLGFTQEEIEVLVPHATHVHLRQARPGRLQERLESWSGTINFRLLFSQLREAGYAGWLATEIGEALEERVDVVAETVRLRDLARAYAGAGA
ncbi:MAG TPA: sugar phosphate isomerase/epimerase [Solirubrobacterales bacterium]